MKIATFSKLLLVSLVLTVSITGCRKGPKGPTPIPGRTTMPPRDPRPFGPETGGPPISPGPRTDNIPIPANPESTPLPPRPGDLSNYDQDREVFAQQTIYFEFDRYNVRSSEIPKLDAVAGQMKSQPASYRLLIEGHCDERGTPGYNVALGERRALAAWETLTTLGLDAARSITLTFGEDKPADPGHDEAAWAKNRRAEFVLLKPKTQF